MANENPSRDSASRQQSSDRSQAGTMSQQGSGTSSSQRSNYGTGSETQGSSRVSYEAGRGTSQGGQGSYGQSGQGSSGQGYGSGTSGQSGYGQASGQGGYGQGHGQGSEYGQGSQGTSTWQGGRYGQGGPLQRRGGSSMFPYAHEGYGSGPFSLMRRISDEMDRFFENFGFGGRSSFFPSQDRDFGGEGQWGGQNAPSMWSPHIEVSERNGKLLIQADLPGIKRDDVNVRIEQDAVIIQGQRTQHQTSNERGYYRSERSYGSFYRTVPLPEGTNADSATASFRDGVLEIELDAPRQQQRGRTLEIRDGGSQGGHVGTGSGSTYGSGTSGSLQGSTSGGTGSAGSAGTQHVGTTGTSGPIHTASPAGGTTATQQSGSGSQSTSGTGQHAGTGSASPHGTSSGTMYSGSGSPSVGSSGTGSTSGSNPSTDRSRGS